MRAMWYPALYGGLFLGVMAVHSIRFGYGPEDAFWRTLMSPFEGTVRAPGFSESAFTKVRIGMIAADVAKLLGDPLRKSCGDFGCLWIYTWQDSGTADFDQRWVLVDATERVSEIRKSFFID